jgi:DNA/RNA-binding domain of Phe-tRNA-synthetase-like protein
LTRIEKGAMIPFINTLVAVSNLASLTYMSPSGLIDLDTIQGDLSLRCASGAETFQPIGGAAQAVSPEAGEFVYMDTATRNVLCRAWSSRGGTSGAVCDATRSSVIDIDCFVDVMSEATLRDALGNVAEMLERHCLATVDQVFCLNRGNPEETIRSQTEL